MVLVMTRPGVTTIGIAEAVGRAGALAVDAVTVLWSVLTAVEIVLGDRMDRSARRPGHPARGS